jgi:hypothetical protein
MSKTPYSSQMGYTYNILYIKSPPNNGGYGNANAEKNPK